MVEIIPRKSDKMNFYKANLHSHSVLSDGHITVEEMKKRYMEKGYSIIAFTDHEGFFNHQRNAFTPRNT